MQNKRLPFCALAMLAFLSAVPFHSIFSQTKKGLQQLKQQQYEAAAASFTADLSNPVLGVAARWGLHEIGRANDVLSLDGVASTSRYAVEADSLYQLLSFKEKKKLAKKYKVSRPKIDLGIKQSQELYLDFLEAEPDLLYLDAYFSMFGRKAANRKLGNRAKQIEERIIRDAMQNASDYQRLNSLMQNHLDFMLKNNLRFSTEFQFRLFNSFIDDYGFVKMDSFAKDHPKHWLMKDCAMDEFVEAVVTDSIPVMIDFMQEYPLSLLHQLMEMAIEDKMERDGRLVLSSLSEFHQRQLGNLRTGRLIFSLNQNFPLSAQVLENTRRILRERAPSPQANLLFKHVLQICMKQKMWEEALELARMAKPLFPDETPKGCTNFYTYHVEKDAWFAAIIPILEAEAEGINLYPLKTLNTYRGDEYSPVISTDGQTLLFAGVGRSDNFLGEDIFESKQVNGRWSAPRLVDSLSSEGNDAPLSITEDGNQLLLFRDNALHISQLGDSGWMAPVPVVGGVTEFSWVGHAVFTPDGSALLFEASNEAREIYQESNTDLYISFRKPDGTWEAPVSLGESINSPYQERSPFLHADGRTLYFSSNVPISLGGMDVYKSVRLDSTWQSWSPPENLGKEINSLADDWGYNFAVSTDGKTAYLATGEPFSNESDLVATSLPKLAQPSLLPVVYQLNLVASNTPPRLPVLVVRDEATGKILKTVRANPNRKFVFTAPPGTTIKLELSDPGLLPVSKMLVVPEAADSSAVVNVDMEVMSIRLGEGIALRKIHFAKNSYELEPASLLELDKLSVFLQAGKHRVEIIGHTDDEGTEAFNQTLSEKRADAVKDYLVGQGVPPKAIVSQGRGETEPIGADQAENRRVEIKFLK